MQRIMLSTLALGLALAGSSWADAPMDLTTVGFITSGAQALEQAAERKTLIFADFTTDWCVWCRRLEKDVFSTAAFQQGTADWVKLTIDAEAEGEGIEWAKRFHVNSYPTTILLNSDGSEIDRYSGYAPMPQFLAVFQDYAAGKGTLAALQAELASAPDNLGLQYAVLEKLEARKAEGWRDAAGRLVAADPGNKAGFAARAAGLLAMADFRSSKNPAALETYVAAWGPTPNGLDARLSLVGFYQRAEDPVAAKRHLTALLAEHGDNAQALNSYAWTAGELNWNLESALAAAHKADSLQPDEVNIIDTVAELEFLNGHKEQAIAAIERAIALDPSSDYLKGQLTKFRGK
ncbi:MAG: thioredoxin fold domain-containing protein [Candidatus Cloacimonetes bacterium]|nr:thioredoxin fold domain-containing protein [Candidatus Cloacimonadota bacterium]